MIAIHSRHAGPAITAAALLLLAGCMGTAMVRLASQAGTAPDAAQVQDASSPEAGRAPTAPSPPRRLNSSLSMPYFSFAQSLNSRS